jgi:hypothetical protein
MCTAFARQLLAFEFSNGKAWAKSRIHLVCYTRNISPINTNQLKLSRFFRTCNCGLCHDLLIIDGVGW